MPKTFSAPIASHIITALKAESIPPESPIMALEKRFILQNSLNAKDKVLKICSSLFCFSCFLGVGRFSVSIIISFSSNLGATSRISLFLFDT